MVAMKKVEGYASLANLTAILKSAIANNEASLIAARVDREERAAANLIRAQQDAAFEESLRVDREKERKRKEAAEKAAEEARKEKEEKEAVAKRAEAMAQLKESLKSVIPKEEEENESKETFHLCFRLPDGSRLERRFRSSDPVRFLYYYVFTSTPPNALLNFKICTTFPSRQLPGHSPTPESVAKDAEDEEMCTPLTECGLEKKSSLFVYDLDS